MSEYEAFDFTTAADALREIRRQYKNHEPLVWNGPDRLHCVVSATNPPPSWYFSDEGMAHLAEEGFGFWDVYTMIAFQLGYHAGNLKEEENTKFWQKDAAFWRNQYLIAAEENEKWEEWAKE